MVATPTVTACYYYSVEYQSAVYSVDHQKSDKYSVRSSRNVRHTNKLSDDELLQPISLSPDIDTRSKVSITI